MSPRTTRIAAASSPIRAISPAISPEPPAAVRADPRNILNSPPEYPVSQSHADLMSRIAETDTTFVQQDTLWIGRCLICGGPVCFDQRTGVGGTNDLKNLGIAHMRCNSEK